MSGPLGTRIGITGHQSLSRKTQAIIAASIGGALKNEDLIVGITSLAAGADQIFAEVVLNLSGQIIVVVPANSYELSFSDSKDLVQFQRLLGRAVEVIFMPFDHPSETAYWAAGRKIVELSDRLIAVWDGEPAAGLGGTGDVVDYARSAGKDVSIVWPRGAARG